MAPGGTEPPALAAPGLSQHRVMCSQCSQLGFSKDAEMLAEYPPKVLEVLSLKRFFPPMPGIKMCISLNNIAHKNHLKICSESRVEGQCFPKENKKLPVHSKF